MSSLADRAGWPRRTRRLLAPREQGAPASTRLRRVETLVLALVAVVFAVATTYDLTRQVRIDNRMHADLVSWQALTHEPYLNNAFVELDNKRYTSRDIVCGWMPRADPLKAAMGCLIFLGPVHDWRRSAVGGYYVLGVGPYRNRQAYDRQRYRYGCIGEAVALGFRCGLPASRTPVITPIGLRAGRPRL